MVKHWVWIAIVLCVVACSPKREMKFDAGDGKTGTVQLDDDGESGTISTEDGTVQFGANIKNAVYPNGSKAYPGAKIVAFTRMAGAGGNGGDLVIINLESPASMADLTAFHVAEAKAAGLTIAAETQSAEGSVIQANGAGETEDPDAGLNIVISRDNGKSMIMIAGTVPPA